ncbi:MAG: DNA-binding protein [Cyanobacteria bacterium P01_A01_bin.123]
MAILSDSVLVESKSARSEQLASISHERSQDILVKLKSLYFALWQGTGIATTEQMAGFYEVPEDSIKKAYTRHQDEFVQDGAKVLRGKALRDARDTVSLASKTSQAIVWTPRATLRLGMILEKSEMAKRVRTSLLGMVENVVPSQQREIEKLRLEVELAKTRERLAGSTQMLAAINPTLPALVFGQPGAVVEVEVPTTVLVDHNNRPIQQFDGVGITYLAKRYGFGHGKKANDQCRFWLRSLGISDADWIEEPSAHVTKKLPRHLLNELDQAMGAKRGNRQFLMGE